MIKKYQEKYFEYIISTIPDLYNDSNPELKPTEKDFLKIKKSINMCVKTGGIFLSVKKKPLGYIFFYQDESAITIPYLFVEREHRREGIANKLMQKVKKEMKKRKCTEIRLNVEKVNKKGLKFYLSQDFEVYSHIMVYKNE